MSKKRDKSAQGFHLRLYEESKTLKQSCCVYSKDKWKLVNIICENTFNFDCQRLRLCWLTTKFKGTCYITKKSCTDGGNPTIYFEWPVTFKLKYLFLQGQKIIKKWPGN